ncbi:MAG: glutamate-1-semialdehyde 2,1-aminomutase [Gaiellaceae bacterium]|nr:glutamate-1-semialdehyde 2,1-aminomutase [Gaiellaceae bacterium]
MLSSWKSERQQSLRERLHASIPGGAHTYAKGDDQWPAEAPALLVRGKGCRVWDVDGNEYIEYGMGLRAVSLGHAYDPVDDAAERAMRSGVNFTRPSLIELECAELFLELVPSAEMVKFTKDGSTATTAAVRLARAVTKRDLVAVCSDHPFFSYDDWFFCTTEMDAGIPASTRALTVTFRYNDPGSLEALFRERPGEIACVVLEPEREDPPRDGFLATVRDLCTRHGALLVLDEMITGFRWCLGGAQAEYGVLPDLTTFGKAMANGFSVSALAGRRDIMERGGLRHDAERVFLLSTTHGAETPALAAAIATMSIYRDEDVIGDLHEIGRSLREQIEAVADSAGVREHFQVVGRDSNLVFRTLDEDRRPSQPFRTLFMQELARRGVLAPSFVVSRAHDEKAIERTVEAVAEALAVYARGLADGVERYLSGPSVKPVYRRFN